MTHYIACVVPAFELGVKAGLGLPIRRDAEVNEENQLKPAWEKGASSVTLPVYYHWEFRTGAAADFEALVGQLTPTDLREITGIGKRNVDITDAFGAHHLVPAGTTLDVTTRLPPVAYINNANVVQLHLGAVDLIINHPQLPPDLSVRLGAEAHANVSLVGNDLVFGGIVVDVVHASTDAINLSATEQQSLQTLLQTLAQQLVNQSLNNALPAIPIPAFPIPGSLSTYGIPPGRIGITSPGLTVAPQHFTLRGGFGVLP
jgi:hypothetical protein